MKTRIALLRAVNVAGRQMVAMSELRKLAARMGFVDVRTFLQSGNLIFRSDERGEHRTGIELERRLEAEIEKRFGIRTDVFVRSALDLNAIIDRNPYRKEAGRDPGRLVAMFLKNAPAPHRVTALEEAIPGRERLRMDGRVLYVVYPDGIGRSKLTNALIDRKLETRGTGRNWNTILKLASLIEK